MKLCSTCLSSCFRHSSILENGQDNQPVVSGALVFVQQDSLTQSDVKSDTLQILDNSSEKRLVFVSRVLSAEISPQKNSELFLMPIPTNNLAESQSPISNQKFQPPVQELQAQALGAQERFQSPIPIKEAPGQVQSTSLTQKAQMLDQRQGWSQSVWDVPPQKSATPLPYQQINYETSTESPSSEFVFGVGFMSIRRRDGVPSSMNGVEISQSPSQVDKSKKNKSGSESPAPSPNAPSGGDKAVRYLLV